MAAGNRKGIKGKLALAGWGLAGLFLAADFFMGGYPAAYDGNGRSEIEIAAAEAGGNAVWEEDQKEEKYIALTFDDEVIFEINLSAYGTEKVIDTSNYMVYNIC